MIRYKKHAALIITFFLLLNITKNTHSNPFFGNSEESPAPPVISGGAGPFTDLQFRYREKIASLLHEMKNGESDVMAIFLAASFLYGLFHAGGPGHRKTIIFSLFLSKKAKIHQPAAAGFLSAGIHAGISVLIILIIWIIERSIATIAKTELVYAYMEGLTFVILAIISVFFIIIKLAGFIRNNKNVTADGNSKGMYYTVIITSLVPCPGATMVLIFSLYLDFILTGIAGVIAMSMGMGIIISIAGYLAYGGREGLFMRLKKKEKLLNKISSFLEMISYSMIFLFSFYMSYPFMKSLLK